MGSGFYSTNCADLERTHIFYFFICVPSGCLYCYTCVFPAVSPLDCLRFPQECPKGHRCLSSTATGKRGQFCMFLKKLEPIPSLHTLVPVSDSFPCSPRCSTADHVRDELCCSRSVRPERTEIRLRTLLQLH